MIFNKERQANYMIPFNIPPFVGEEIKCITDAINQQKLCGDGSYTKKCHSILETLTGAKKALLTTSCTDALEMSAILCDIQPGDEVIMPSYTFVSTANAFVLRGATIVFVDIKPETMNIDEKLIEYAITEKTKAIVPVHYAGIGCEMDTILEIARKHKLFVVEDAAQAVGATYKGKPLGTFGEFGTFSFHETKNISSGEGGALLINDEKYVERAEIIREKGTNRSKFFRGQVDKYTWCDLGSSYLPSELNAAYLFAQLEQIEKINNSRIDTWNFYNSQLTSLAEAGDIEIAKIPEHCTNNAHMFWVKVRDLEVRTSLMEYLKEQGVLSVFHYIPLHSAPAGNTFGRFHGEDKYTTKESERLLRLPMYFNMEQKDRVAVVEAVQKFFEKR